MRMTVAGVHRYAVKVPEQRIYNETAEELDGLAIESRRLLLISPAVHPDRREEILSHELQHAWEFHVPPPRTEEERCQLAATIQQQLRLDLDAQGGIPALLELKPTPIALPFKSAPPRKSMPIVMGNTAAWECGNCQAMTMCGSIENGPVEYHEGVAQYQLARWFRCDVCNVLNIWREVATADGQATGTLVQVPAPRMLTGRAATDWLAEHAPVTSG